MRPIDPAGDDAAALAVEAIFEAATTPPSGGPAPRMEAAVWFCVCADDGDIALTWLVTDGDLPGTVRWQRVPDDVDITDLAPPGTPATGAHVDAAGVLAWLQHEAETPSLFDDNHDRLVFGRLRALCTRSGAVLPMEN